MSVSGDTGRTERAMTVAEMETLYRWVISDPRQMPRDVALAVEAFYRHAALVPEPEQSAVRLTLDEWGVPDAVEPPNTVVAPEPSGVPPEHNRSAVITGLRTLAKEDTWHGAVWETCTQAADLLEQERATTEVERVAPEEDTGIMNAIIDYGRCCGEAPDLAHIDQCQAIIHAIKQWAGR